MEESPTSTQEMEWRRRLITLDAETPPRLRDTEKRNRNRNAVPRPPPSPNFLFKLLTLTFLLCLFLTGIEDFSCHHRVTAQYTQFDDPFTNNKIFHHNRTSPATLAILAQRKPSKSHDKIKKKSPVVGGGGSVTSDQKFKPHKPSSVQTNLNINNVNNYFKTAINFLSMGLGVTTPKSAQWSQRPSYYEFSSSTPSALGAEGPPAIPISHSTFDPLSILKTSMSTSDMDSFDSTTNSSTSIEGRSNFEFEPLFESSFGKTNVTSVSSKNLVPGFFDKFEDHWNDPDAQESMSSFTVIDPKFHTPTSGGNPRPPNVHHMPERPKPTTHEKYSSSNMKFSPAAVNENYYTNNQKNVNYWPTKLNSYYGNRYTGVSYVRRPEKTQGHIQHSSFDGPGFGHYDGTKEHEHLNFKDEIDKRPSGSSAIESVLGYKEDTIIERVSIFYSQYKVLAWGIIIVLAALAAFGVLVGLYFRNPPTEVVTARQKLTEAINDPKLMTFLKSQFLSLPTSSRRVHSLSSPRRKKRIKRS